MLHLKATPWPHWVSFPGCNLSCPFMLFQPVSGQQCLGLCRVWATSSSLCLVCTSVPSWPTYEPDLATFFLHHQMGSQVLYNRAIPKCPHLGAFRSSPWNSNETVLVSSPHLTWSSVFDTYVLRVISKNALEPTPKLEGNWRCHWKKKDPKPRERPTDW